METKIVKIHKSQSVLENQPTKNLTIVIDEEIPDFNLLISQDVFTHNEAVDLENALYKVLPGATYDYLAGLILGRISSHFRVPHSVVEINRNLLDACKFAESVISTNGLVEMSEEAAIEKLNAAIFNAEAIE